MYLVASLIKLINYIDYQYFYIQGTLGLHHNKNVPVFGKMLAIQLYY